MKRDLKATAQAFLAEGKVSSDPVGELHGNRTLVRKGWVLICGFLLKFVVHAY